MKRDTILVINNESKFIGELEAYLESLNIVYKDISYNVQVSQEDLSRCCGIFISGGPGIPHKPLDPTNVYALIEWATKCEDDIPVMGFCLGAEIITYYFGGTVKKHKEAQHGDAEVELTEEGQSRGDSLLPKDQDAILLYESHSYFIDQVPEDFVVLASSENCPAEIIKHKTMNIFGYQGHPEKSGYDGKPVIDNFLILCGKEKAIQEESEPLVGLGTSGDEAGATNTDEWGATG